MASVPPLVRAVHSKVEEVSLLKTTEVDETLVASISQLFTRNNIPCVLWGNYLLTVYGVPTIVDSIDFVIPDNLIAAAVSTLQNKGLTNCRDPKSCSVNAYFRPSPPPAAHYHIGVEHTLSIYKQSSTLWLLPSLKLSPESMSSPDVILASDSHLPPPRPGRGHGAFRADSSPVCIPSAHRLLEAYVRLLAGTTPESPYIQHWMGMVNYIEEYVDGDGYLTEANLETRCREFYSGLKSDKVPVRTLFRDLKARFSGSVN